ncbi:MAG: 50S ribosomal protein L21 [Candidatus Pacebacteria bacterium]|jgi:large subunit ribosomal protein L21|nr:50S ribosomal protein L21 [Candidatus Paceibacterota bacterium]
MLAVIKTGGKQYIVTPGQKLKIEKLEGEAGKTVKFEEVLLVETDDKKVEIGQPTVKGAAVSAKIVAQTKGPKVIAYKYKAKKRYHLKKGHRQQLTEVQIDSISL